MKYMYNITWLVCSKCEAARMRVSTSKFEAMILSWKRVDYPLREGTELLLEEFKYLRTLLTSEGRLDHVSSGAAVLGCRGDLLVDLSSNLHQWS